MLVYCWEAGSAGALIPVIRRAIAEGWQLQDISLEPGANILGQAVPGLERCADGEERAGPFDVVLAGVGHPKHKAGWFQWQKLNGAYPALAILDHWKGLERFQCPDGSVDDDVLPRKICVIDESVRDQLRRMGVAAERIEIIGNMAICESGKCLPGTDREVLRQRIGLSPDAPLYFLASETIHRHGFHALCDGHCHPLEQHVLASGATVLQWASAQARAAGATLVLRPHPNQPLPVDIPQNVHVVPWAMAVDDEMLLAADKIFGLSSMINAKAVAMGKVTENLADLLVGWTPAQSFISAEIWDQLVARGILGSGPVTDRREVGRADPRRVLQLLRTLAI